MTVFGWLLYAMTHGYACWAEQHGPWVEWLCRPFGN